MSGRGIRGSLIFQTGEASAPLQSSNFRAQLQARSNDTVYGPKKKKKKEKKSHLRLETPPRNLNIYIWNNCETPADLSPHPDYISADRFTATTHYFRRVVFIIGEQVEEDRFVKK